MLTFPYYQLNIPCNFHNAFTLYLIHELLRIMLFDFQAFGKFQIVLLLLIFSLNDTGCTLYYSSSLTSELLYSPKYLGEWFMFT